MKALILTILLLAYCFPASAQEYEDGTYDATVTTQSGSYTVPVDVEDGQVTGVHWPNGGNMNVIGADISGSSASGSSYDGGQIDVEIDR